MFTTKTPIVWAVSILALTGCLDGTKNPLSNGQGNPSVSNVSLTNNTFVFNGANLDQIKSVQVSGGGKTIPLSIANQGKGQITATASSPLTLILGVAYSLLISTAKADTISVPVTIQVPNGYMSPSVLTGANAAPGQVLKWNGTAWVPAPDYVGVGAHQFAGFTPPTNGSMGGLREHKRFVIQRSPVATGHDTQRLWR